MPEITMNKKPNLIENKKIQFKKKSFLVFYCFLSFFLLIGTGRLNVDSFYSYLTAKSLSQNLSLSISERKDDNIVTDKSLPHSAEHWEMGANKGNDGNYYSKYGLFWALCMVPFFIISLFLSNFLSVQPDLLGIFTVSLIGPCLTALILMLFFKVAHELKINSKACVYTIFLIAFGSINVYYARGPYVETLDTLLLLSIILFFQRLILTKQTNYLIGIGFFVGIAFFTKIYNVILIVPVTIGLSYLFLVEFKYKWKDLIYVFPKFFFPLSILGLLFLYSNYIRYDSLFFTGYGGEITPFNIFEGLGGFLYSPGKSIFLLNPGLILAVLGIKEFYFKNKALCLLILLIFLTFIIFLSNFPNWMAGPWGTRYMLPSIIIFHIPALFIIQDIVSKKQNYFAKFGFSFIIIVSLLINMPNLFIDQGRWNLIGLNTGLFKRFDITHNILYSPIRGSWYLFLSSAESFFSGKSKTISIKKKDSSHIENHVQISLSGYDECNIWFMVILRESITRYDGSVTSIHVSQMMKTAIYVISMVLLLQFIITIIYLFKY